MLVDLQDPSKPAIKKHHSLVLRCESASEKYAWLARLKYVSETAPADRPVRSYKSRDFTESARRGGAEKDGRRGDRRAPDGRPPKVGCLRWCSCSMLTYREQTVALAYSTYQMWSRLSIVDGDIIKLHVQAPPTPGTPHVEAAMGGIASTVLFQEDSKLGPEPMSYGLFEGEDARGFDGFLAQLGEDTAAYVRTVCNTIVLTVPKAIIHCQVRGLLRASSKLQQVLTDVLAGWCECDLAACTDCGVLSHAGEEG